MSNQHLNRNAAKINQDPDARELMAMSKDELSLVEHEVYKWPCDCLGCDRFTRIKDFGVSPYFYHRGQFCDMNNWSFFCGKHWKMHKKGQSFPRKIAPSIDYLIKQ